ncbi:MAG: hypothetical protein LBD67_07740 [Candidatus Accumulibacter sp.]|nr:hypothetical protein [Accumulibacter sp.]
MKNYILPFSPDLFFFLRLAVRVLKTLSALSLPNHRHPLSPFVLSLSKYERTLQIMNDFSNPDSFFESFFNPYPSTSFLRQAQDGAGRTD